MLGSGSYHIPAASVSTRVTVPAFLAHTHIEDKGTHGSVLWFIPPQQSDCVQVSLPFLSEKEVPTTSPASVPLQLASLSWAGIFPQPAENP